MKKITLFLCAVFLSAIGFALGSKTLINLEHATGDPVAVSDLNSAIATSAAGDCINTSAFDTGGDFPLATNDEACTATVLNCGEVISQSMEGATATSSDECFGSGTADVWFSFSSDGSQILTVAEDSTFDAVVQLFKGDACGNLEEVGACKDGPENYTVTETGNYYFRVRPYFAAGETETISVSLTCVDYDCPTEQTNFGDACDDGDPTTFNDVVDEDCNCAGVIPAEGDVCDTAIAVACDVPPATYSSVGSIAMNETSCSLGNKGLWFSFMGTGGNITVNSSATFDHEMSINRGTCDNLTNVICKDGSSSDEAYTIDSSVVGEMYYVYIAHWLSSNTTTGDITIAIVCDTPPDCIAPSLELEVQDIDGASIDACLDSDSEFYVLATLSGGDGNDAYSLTANSEDAVEVAVDGTVVFGPFAAGTNVDVSAVGVQDADCSVSESIDSPAVCPPANDDCAGAINLECDVTITGTTANATASGIPTTCGSFSSTDARDLFYSFEADGTSDYIISLGQPEGSFGLDGVLFVYSGTCDALASLSCSDLGGTEVIELLAPDAGTYIVRFFDYSGTADFILDFECIDGTMNVNDNQPLSGISLYPNPMVDQVIIANPKNLQLKTASIYDLTGRLVKTVDLKGSTSETVLDVSSLSNATYVLMVTGKNGQISKLMVKE